MVESSFAEEALRLALDALDPIRESLVVVGGTAHRLFPRHDKALPLDHEPLTTEDVDIALPVELASRSLPDLRRRMDREFVAEIQGADRASFRYRTIRELQGARPYVQFIARRVGTGTTRAGKANPILEVGGLVAEELPSVEMLLHEPWALDLAQGGSKIVVQVVNPVAFVAQKAVIAESRPSAAKRGKDLLYVYDTLSMFSSLFGEQGPPPAWCPELGERRARKLVRACKKHWFSIDASDTCREAAALARDQRVSPPDARTIAASCSYGVPRFLSALCAKWA
jgi:hypothetical protein